MIVLATAMATAASTIVIGAELGSAGAGGRTVSGARIPKDFHRKASLPVGEGRNCVVGYVQDEDWTYSHPYVYLTSATGGRPVWVKKLKIPEDFFGGRATHCLRSGDFLYVLLQLDTYASASLNQGIVHVVKLDLESGSVVAETPIVIPEAKHNYSAWVWGKDAFRQEAGKIRVVGMYRYMHTNDDDDLPFSVVVRM
ncbi:hypothetical protein [Luteibacter sp. OK325]|uniref:hypothetical protein n=1 Tax=Luteibacter sp. OK325 TaxID=2135670 RepID=UPI0011B1F83B|nr:hypothetical protein [Luteibacter sp. OK325]